MRELASALHDARERTLALVGDLSDEQLIGPRLAIVNPLLWEIGHVAWFQEWWTLRDGGRLPSIRTDADRLWDSTNVAHETRWDLPLPPRIETLAYMARVLDAALERLGRSSSPSDLYPFRLALSHEDMHGEAFLMMRQALAYPACASLAREPRDASAPVPAGDVEVPGCAFRLGAERGEEFVFDNEKWAHEVHVEPFAIARAAVTQREFAAFVEDGGYERDALWSEEGRRWRDAEGVRAPQHWRREGRGWLRRRFDAWIPLEPDLPMVHVSWHEAQAWCRWAGRRLPTEAEWELAASGPSKSRFPWGDAPPDEERAHLDGALGCVSAGARAAGDGAFGCRQMIGNVWEWTADDFRPFPGFVRDPYKEYSEPWFGTHKTLRGGSFATRSRLLRTTWRNFYLPGRRDVFAGFRTCADPSGAGAPAGSAHAAAERRLAREFADAVRAGLTAPRKHLSCRWLYDEQGSALFESICEVPEYYIPAAEREVLSSNAREIVRCLPAGGELVELGSGSAEKTRILLTELVRRDGRARYVPIDISRTALDGCTRALRGSHPEVEVAPFLGEYEDAILRLRRDAERPRLVLWLGSNIGNLDRVAAAGFLGRLARALSSRDRVLVGIDLRKDRATIERAYDDARGVTARFNRNLLARVNRELGGAFDLERFRHRAVWMEREGRVEMHLVAEEAMRVAIARLGLTVEFAAGESIHTEDSYKYSIDEIGALATAAGLRIERAWSDARGLFRDVLFAP